MNIKDGYHDMLLEGKKGRKLTLCSITIVNAVHGLLAKSL